MHSVDLLEEALHVAMNSGLEIRQEWMNERGGGLCRVGQRWVLYVDLSLTAKEQLEQIIHALKQRNDLRIHPECPPQLTQLLC